MKKSVNFQNMKYKQTEIPSVEIKARRDLRRYVMEEYSKNVQGKTVKNKDRGLTVFFGADGKNELAHGRAIYAKKAALVQCIVKLMEVAEYNNFGQRKDKDQENVFGYANFKAKVYINGVLEHVRITVVVKANGKAYYCHEVNIIKKK